MQILRKLKSWPVYLLTGAVMLISISSLLWAANNAAMEERIRRDLAYLASEECEGRGVETEGLKKAAKYIAKQFQEAGLKPAGKGGDWYQPFTMTGAARLEKGSRLVLHGPQGQSIELQEGKHFQVMGYSAGGDLKAPVVFVGYGATAEKLGYDDYQDIDVAGKVVIVVRKLPRWDNQHAPFGGNQKEQLASLINKLTNAELHKAAAMIFVNDEGEKGDRLMQFQDLSRGFSAGSIPAFHVKRSVVDQMLRSSTGRGLAETEAAISRELKPHSAALTGWQAQMDSKVNRKDIHVKNVIGVRPGSGPLAKEYVVIGAHYDHLGYGERGSLAKKEDRDKIHFGADDNASGTTAMMELARRFGQMNDYKGRTLIFMAFSAEEKGLLGSRHYCNKEPLFPLKDTVAMVNLDMVGRMSDNKLIVQGIGSAKEFAGLIDDMNKKYKFELRKVQAGTGPSDHDSFYRKQVPVLFFWTGTHKDYHRPSDTFDKINYDDMVRITNMAGDVVSHLAVVDERPQYVAAKETVVRPKGNIPRLGIRPAYDEENKGLLVEDVSTGGAAEKGGMKAGDRIVAIGDQAVTNINTYMAVIARQKRGEAVPITVERGKKKVTLKIVPE